jgi:rhamnose utilization protein RhaD (predicted bifunctional aldolase and dehydrogenase)
MGARGRLAQTALSLWEETMPDILDQLVAMSNNLGQPELDYAILGEGNTSARADAGSFWVKASGYELRTIGRNGFVRVSMAKALAILDVPQLTDQALKQLLTDARMDTQGAYPSVETVLHAIALGLDGVNFVGHTHPTAVNVVACSAAFETATIGRIFPDEVVACGPASVLVPYVDPGVPLARMVKERIDQYLDEYGEVPRVILMQNHGLIALGRTAQQVENITAMAVKAARILSGTYALGGPHFLSPKAVARIHTRPDELLRRKVIG